jgi:hypothetical protein
MLRESGEQTVAQRVEGVQRACGQQGAEGVHQLLCRSKAQLARFNIVPLCRRRTARDHANHGHKVLGPGR